MSSLRPLVLLCLYPLLSAQTIQTIAGGGPYYLQALKIGLASPTGIAIDPTGNIYLSLSSIHQVWKIDTAGFVSRFAGNGLTSTPIDGTAAITGGLSLPQGLALDNAGNLYVADTNHNQIRKISPLGITTTAAGNGTAGAAGDGGLATAAQLNAPSAIAIDSSNNLYICDRGNNKIRMVSPPGLIATVAGTGVPGFSGDNGPATSATLNQPSGIALDSSGALYVTDTLNYRVRKLQPGGTIATFAGTGTVGYSGDGGPATAAGFLSLNGIAIDKSNNIYIVEANRIRLIAANQLNIVTFAGSGAYGSTGDGGAATSASFQNLSALAVNSLGIPFLADASAFRIRKVVAGIVSTVAGNGSPDFNANGLAAVNASLFQPSSLIPDNAGNLYFADLGSSGIRSVTLTGGLLSMAVGTGYAGSTPDASSITQPVAAATTFTRDSNGTFYFVEGSRIRKTSGGVYTTIANTSNTVGNSGDGGLAIAAQFSSQISGLAVASNGDLYIADTSNNRVRRIDAQTGIVTAIAGTGAANSTGDGGLATSATLNGPRSLSLDGAGNLFIAEPQGNRIRKIVLATNLISTAAGNGSTAFANGVAATATGLSSPNAVFADQSSNLFIADTNHLRVRRVDAATNLISTVAGTGKFGTDGDGGPATSASLDPYSLTVDRSQKLYIGDVSGRIRRTTVTACFFTIGTPVVYVASGGTTGSVTVKATSPNCPYNVSSSLPFVTITSGASGTGTGTVMFTVASAPGTNRTATVNIGGASFTVAQAGAVAPYNVGYFQPSGSTWALDSNGSGGFDLSDKLFPFAAQAGAIAVTGDWNGDGRTKIGYYLKGFWVLDYNGNGFYDGPAGGDKFYAFGGVAATYIPITGDWNGDGKTKIGYYNNGKWALDTNGNGTFDAGDGLFTFGGNGANETPLLGDWNGDKRTKVGFFFQGKWTLDYDGNGTFTAADKYYTTFPYASGDKPVTGDWTGDGKTKIGIFRGGFWILDTNNNGAYDGTGPGQDKFYGFGGNAGEIPFVADWNGSGTSKIGIYINGFWVLDYNGNGTYDGTGPGGDRFIPFSGGPGSQPIIGRW